MNDIKVFENPAFGQVRTMVIDNEPYFVGKDVAEALGYSNSRKAIADHVDEDDKGVTECDTLGGKQQISVINESGLYSLIMSSQLDNAKAFKKWVTSEVLPSIRKTGGYIAASGNESDEEIMAKALAIANATLKRRDERIKALENDNVKALAEVKQKEQIIEEQSPSVNFANAIVGSKSSILVGELAKILRQNGCKTIMINGIAKSMGQNHLLEWFRENGIFGKCGERYNIPNQRYIEQGLFELKTNAYSVNGKMCYKNTTKVTGKGQQHYVNRFCPNIKPAQANLNLVP